MNRWIGIGGALLLASAALFACGEARRVFDVGGGAFDVDASADPDAAAGVPDCTGRRTCSRDLRTVVDACDDTKVLGTCAPEDGCAAGECVPACAAAVSTGASVGCEFVTLPPAASGQGDEGSCFAAFVTNTWATSAKVEAEYDGKALDVATAGRVVRTAGAQVSYEVFDGQLEPGEVVALFLAEDPTATGNNFIGCPDGVTPAVLADTSIAGTARGTSFRIRTTAPVSAYSIYPFGGADSHVPSATLLLPVAAWKPGYIIANAWEIVTALGSTARPTTQIVAAEDDTEVTIVGTTSIQNGLGVEGAGKGQARTWKLAKGEVVQLVQSEELTGSTISANKNVGLWGGHQCMLVPSGQFACDSAQLQLFPVQSWGREYAVVPYISRRQNEIPEDYYYRIVGAVDGTTLEYEPSRPDGAPFELAAGQVGLFRSREPFVVRSQDAEHPFAVYAYMSGYNTQQAMLSDGDPEFVGVIPTEQYLDRYVFYVDPSYPNSQLVIVRAREEGEDFEPVTLDCAGELEGWAPLGSSGKYEAVRVRLTKQRIPQKIGAGTCGAGRREVHSRGAVGVTVWGTGFAASYGYPGGAAIRALNSVDTRVR